MNTRSIQLSRARTINWFNSDILSGIRWFSYCIAIVSVVLLVISSLQPLSPNIFSLALLGIIPGLKFGMIELYFRYIQTFPLYGLSKKVIAEQPLNRVDIPVAPLFEVLLTKSPDLFVKQLYANDNASTILLRLAISTEELINDVTQMSTIQKEEIVTKTLQKAEQTEFATIFDFIAALLETAQIQEKLQAEKINTAQVGQLLQYYSDRHQSLVRRKKFWLNLRDKTGGFAKDWAVNYTNTLDEFASEISLNIRWRAEQYPLLNRTQLLKTITQELSKTSAHNVLLVGAQGSGRTEMFYHLADELLHYQTKTELDGIDIRVLDVPKLLGAVGSPEQLQQLLTRIFSEITRSGRVLLFIDPLDSLLNPSEKLGTIDLKSLLGSYLSDERIYLIGTLQSETYVTQVKADSLLSTECAKVEVPEPTQAEMLPIILSHLPVIESRYRSFFLVRALEELIALAPRYIKDASSPQREIGLAEEVASQARQLGKAVVTEELVNQVIERKSGVPIEVSDTERQTLSNLPAILHQRIVGQDEAILKISDALLRSRAGLANSSKPIGSFLFLGPTGVGKTETAKALSATYFGSEDKLIRLDMTEYGTAAGLEKLLGLDATTQPGTLTVALQENPSATVLFDEVEKANPLVQNALLQVVDEGRLTTNFGRTLDFTNTIIIATSNAGSNYIREQIEANRSVKEFEKNLINQLLQDKVFLPEFLNRFDSVVVYTPLNKAQVREIVLLQVSKLSSRLNDQKGITLKVASNVLDQLATRGYDPVFGARALERTIKNDLETVIAKKIVEINPAAGTTLTITELT